MTLFEQAVTIAVIVAGTMLTRFLPFLLFRFDRPVPPFVTYLGKVLPGAVFAILVVYCLKNVSIFTGSHGLSELVSLVVVVVLHLWRRQMLVSITAGTVCYMLLVQFVF